MAITRQTLTDSSGDQLTGTVITNAVLQAIYDSIELTWAVDSWTPALTAATSNPGVSSATGTYFRLSKACLFRANFTLSSVGTGSYFCSLPFTATTGVGLINAFAQDISAGGTIYNGKGFIDPATPTKFTLLTDDALLAANWSPTSPFTFASPDLIEVMGLFFTT